MNYYSLAELFENSIGDKILIRSFDSDSIDIESGEISFLWVGHSQYIKVLRQDSGNSAIYSEDDDIFWDDADGDIGEFDALVSDWLATHGYCKYNCKQCKTTYLGTELVCPNCKYVHYVNYRGRVRLMGWSSKEMCWVGQPFSNGNRPISTKADPPKQFGYKLIQRGANPDGTMDERHIGICQHHYDQLLGINYYTGEHKCWPLKHIDKYQEDTGVFMAEYGGSQGVYCTCCYHKSLDILNLAWQPFANFLAATGGSASSFYLRDVETLNPEWASVYRELDRLLWEKGRKGYREIDAFLRHYTAVVDTNK